MDFIVVAIILEEKMLSKPELAASNALFELMVEESPSIRYLVSYEVPSRNYQYAATQSDKTKQGWNKEAKNPEIDLYTRTWLEESGFCVVA